MNTENTDQKEEIHPERATMNPSDYAERGSLKHGDITEKIIGAFYDVYNELGFGFLESVYHKAM
jgi:hypothetical protein